MAGAVSFIAQEVPLLAQSRSASLGCARGSLNVSSLEKRNLFSAPRAEVNLARNPRRPPPIVIGRESMDIGSGCHVGVGISQVL